MTPPWYTALVSLITPDQWEDAVLGTILGAVLSGLFAASTGLFKALRDRRPLKRLLGSLAESTTATGLYIRGMFVQGNTFYSRDPEYHPGMAGTVTVRSWVNIPEVFGAADVRAASQIASLLGTSGKQQSLVFRSIVADWDKWDEPAFSIGGHFKTDQILKHCQPSLVSLQQFDRFRVGASGPDFVAIGDDDFGLIYKGFHPTSGQPFIAIMGLGAVGTEAAAYYFHMNAPQLGRTYGSDPFALVIRAPLTQGYQGGSLAWASTPTFSLRHVLHPLLYRQYRARSKQKAA